MAPPLRVDGALPGAKAVVFGTSLGRAAGPQAGHCNREDGVKYEDG